MDKVKVPCEVIMWYGLPAIRREFAKVMMNEYGLSQKEVAKKLGVTDAAISQYLSAKRGKVKIKEEKIIAEIRKSAKRIIEGDQYVMVKEICRICEILKSMGMVERIMKKMDKNEGKSMGGM